MKNLLAVLVTGLAISQFSLGAMAGEAPDPALLAQAKVDEAAASKIALAKVPGGTVQSAELENEHGKLVWSFDITQPKTTKIREILVDAKSGKIVAMQTESASAQAKEAKQEQKEAAEKAAAPMKK